MSKSKRKNASFKSRSNTAKERNTSKEQSSETNTSSAKPINYSECPSAPLWRRLASMVYDGLISVALWMLTASVFLLVKVAIIGNKEELTSSQLNSSLLPLLLAVTFMFYYWFWTHGGQTLGMRAWRLKVIDGRLDGTPPHFVKCLLRFMGAFLSISAFGLGYIWVLFDPNKDTWHDRISGTRTLVVPKEENKKNRFKDSRRIPKDPV